MWYDDSKSGIHLQIIYFKDKTETPPHCCVRSVQFLIRSNNLRSYNINNHLHFIPRIGTNEQIVVFNARACHSGMELNIATPVIGEYS